MKSGEVMLWLSDREALLSSTLLLLILVDISLLSISTNALSDNSTFIALTDLLHQLVEEPKCLLIQSNWNVIHQFLHINLEVRFCVLYPSIVLQKKVFVFRYLTFVIRRPWRLIGEFPALELRVSRPLKAQHLPLIVIVRQQNPTIRGIQTTASLSAASVTVANDTTRQSAFIASCEQAAGYNRLSPF